MKRSSVEGFEAFMGHTCVDFRHGGGVLSSSLAVDEGLRSSRSSKLCVPRHGGANRVGLSEYAGGMMRVVTKSISCRACTSPFLT